MRSGVVQPFYPRHFRDEEVPFVTVNLVHEDAVHAQLVEVDDILGGMAVLQFVQTFFEAAFALFLRLFLTAVELRGNVACPLNPLHFVQFRLIFRPHEVGIVLNHIE